MLSVDLSVSKLPNSSLPLCELGCSVFSLPAFLPFRQRPLVDNIRSGKKDAAEERGETTLFLFCLKSFVWGECCKGGKSRSEDPCSLHPQQNARFIRLQFIFGGKGQCAALWDLPKIITNTQN